MHVNYRLASPEAGRVARHRSAASVAYVGSLKSRGAKQPYKSGAWSNERRCFSKKKKPARGKQCWLERLSEVEDTA